MRALPILLAPLILLAACEPDQRNIQADADTRMRQLEERANQIRAEAENGVEAQAAPLENEADVLLNQIAGNAAEGTRRSSRPTPSRERPAHRAQRHCARTGKALPHFRPDPPHAPDRMTAGGYR